MHFRNGSTVLFLSATYNYAASLGEGTERQALGLYTLGHIFEQSITELEMLVSDRDHPVSFELVVWDGLTGSNRL